MTRFATTAALLMLMITTAIFAQPGRRMGGGTITGQVYDSQYKQPIEYANIILYRQQDSTQVTGTITDSNGNFELSPVRPGRYYVEVFFLGYETRNIGDVRINPRNVTADLGKIALKQSALSMEAVEVEGERPPMTYMIDKKVINVSHQQTAVSGSAIEVLENVPSITVDIEGNVSLRGSGNFRVLIDGRPSILDAADALQQIPASSIENIEIITNPSAKYNPEGTAGIINIVMKKNQGIGRSGLFNLNGGLNDKYGGDFLLNQKNDKYSLTLGVDYSKRSYPGSAVQRSQTTRGDKTSYVNSNGDSDRGRTGFGLRGSADYNLTESDILSFSGRYGTRDGRRNSTENYREWTSLDPTRNIYTSENHRERSGEFYGLNLSYLHRFQRKGHELTGDLQFSHHQGDEKTTNELLNQLSQITDGRTSTEDGPGRDLRAKVDYVLPLGGKSKFESGYQSEFDRSEDNNRLYEYQPETDKYQFMDRYSHNSIYERDIHSLYAIYSGMWNKFGYQGGLRGEYTYRITELASENRRFTIDRWDYFPTLHMSYQFSGGQQFMASYTRRIDRPRGYFLEPFETWMDAYNVRIGNPDLQPEYIDSYETGFQTFFGKTLLSAEVYYRISDNKVERVRSVYDDNVTLHTVANVGKDYALGSEFMLNMDVIKNWNVSLMGNLYNYRVEGQLYNQDFSRESFNWNLRLNNSVKLWQNTQLQLNGRYHSPSVSAQGTREDFLVTDFAVKQEFFEKSLSATLQVRDLFGTMQHEFTSSGPDFYNYMYFDRESPVVMLNIQYNINDYKKKRERGDNWDNGMDEDEF